MPVLGFVFVACSFPPPDTTPQTGGPTPREGGPQCSEDSEVDDLFAVDTPTPQGGPPLVRAAIDADGAAAVWYDETGGLSFRRWDERGAALSPATSIVPNVRLLGDEGMSPLSIGYGAGVYLVAHANVTFDVSAWTVTPEGKAQRAQHPRNASEQDGLQVAPFVSGRDDAVFLQWTTRNTRTHATKTMVQAYGAEGGYAYALGAPPDAEGDVDAVVSNRIFSLVHYEPGSSLAGDQDVVFRQAKIEALEAWSSSTLALPRPPGMRRADPALLAVDDHTFFVDRASWSDGAPKNRIEIAEIDAAGTMTKDHSIDLRDDRVEVTNPALAREGNRVYVAWIDTVVTGEATFNVWMLDRDTGATKTAAAPLSLGKGRGVIRGHRPMGGIRVKGGAVRTSHVWTTADGARPTLHVGLRTLCVAR